jgi:hypothetical protein
VGIRKLFVFADKENVVDGCVVDDTVGMNALISPMRLQLLQ